MYITHVLIVYCTVSVNNYVLFVLYGLPLVFIARLFLNWIPFLSACKYMSIEQVKRKYNDHIHTHTHMYTNTCRHVQTHMH